MEAFEIWADHAALEDLQQRLARMRWPNDVADSGWTFGTDPAYLRELVDYWQHEFDWRAREAELNRMRHFRTTIDGTGIHFVHERGIGPRPLPLVLTHGWPGTFYDFSKMIPLLTDPGACGGDPADAFDVVVPSLPGYGYSDSPVEPWFSREIPSLWVALMESLGYARFGAHGLDVGSSVCNRLAIEYPRHIAGIHVTYTGEPYLGPGSVPLSQREQEFLAGRPGGQEAGGGYAHIQRTKPVTLAYGLSDSPVGLAAWIIEKYRAWSDCGGDIESRFSKDELLTTVMIYWLTGTIGSSFRIYRDWALGAESNPAAWGDREEIPRGIASKPLSVGESIDVPAAVALFPADPPASMPREWAERVYSDLRRFGRMPRGGHFPAMEEPELLANDLREFFRPLRERSGVSG
jgi:pimeloyl-ACP methyl ester carboxylesterase